MKDKFSEVYATDAWGGGSGSGSRGAAASSYAGAVNEMARTFGWKSAVDVGCGDGVVLGMLKFATYTGFDCVPWCIEECRKLYDGDGTKSFIEADVFDNRELLPAADVLLCRDVLHHWPSRSVCDWVGWVRLCVRAGRWKAAVLSFDADTRRSGECAVGGYRPLAVGVYPLQRLTEAARIGSKAVIVIR